MAAVTTSILFPGGGKRFGREPRVVAATSKKSSTANCFVYPRCYMHKPRLAGYFDLSILHACCSETFAARRHRDRHRSPLENLFFLRDARSSSGHMAKQGETTIAVVQLRSVRGPPKSGMLPNRQTTAGSRNSRNSSKTGYIVSEYTILARDYSQHTLRAKIVL